MPTNDTRVTCSHDLGHSIPPAGIRREDEIAVVMKPPRQAVLVGIVTGRDADGTVYLDVELSPDQLADAAEIRLVARSNPPPPCTPSCRHLTAVEGGPQ